MNSNIKSNTLHHKLPRLLFILTLIFSMVWGVRSKLRFETATPVENDYLIYANLNTDEIVFYDPVKNIHRIILSNWHTTNFQLSSTGRLAFTGTDNDLYVIDYPFTQTPTKVVDGTHSEFGTFLMAWSLDGNRLAYTGHWLVRPKSLYVWDGKQSTKIASAIDGFSDLSWSPHGHLAFVQQKHKQSDTEEDANEILIWNGESLLNLSQNPLGFNRMPRWSDDGHIAFLSEVHGVHNILVWDGISMVDNQPNIAEFKNITPHPGQKYTLIQWTEQNTLIFKGLNPTTQTNRFYEWHSSQAVHVSQRPIKEFDQRWHTSGYSYEEHKDQINIQDQRGRTRLRLGGDQARWSKSGYFSFCKPILIDSYWVFDWTTLPKIKSHYRGWTLSVGNGNNITELTQSYEILATWSNGNKSTCEG